MRVGFVAELRVGEGLPFANRNGCKLHAVGHVTDREDGVAGAAVVGVDHDGSA